MKQFKFLLFSFLFLTIFASQSFASHFSGGQISLQYTGVPNTYLVNMSLTYYCDGASPTLTPAVTFTNNCGFTNITETLNLVLDQEVSAVNDLFCPEATNCNGGSIPGMRLLQYQKIVELEPCNSWTVAFASCCRNGTTNVNGQPGFYLETIFNTATSPTNSSPSIEWTPTNGFDPIPYGCATILKTYALNVVENDGDSLVFSFTSALVGPGQPVLYNAGFSGTPSGLPAPNPSGPIPNINIDPNTGLMEFTATIPGVYIITILIEEYDAFGNLLSSMMHDFQFVAEICANNQPSGPSSVSNFNPNNSGAQYSPQQNSISMCVGDQFCFDVTFSDIDGDSLELVSNAADILPGATFDVIYQSPAGDTITGAFCWVFQAGYSGSIINITAKELICIPGTSTFSVNLNIPPFLNVSANDSICGNQVAELSATGQGPITWSVITGEPMNVPNNFTCLSCNTPVATPSITTTYLVEDGSICSLTDTIEVFVAQNYGDIDVEIFTADDSLCPDNCLQVEAVTVEEENIPVVAGPWNYNGLGTDVGFNSIVDVPVPTALAQMAPQTTVLPGMICEVCVDIDHGATGDLLLELVAPNGQTAVLSDHNGGNGANYTNTCFVMNHPLGLPLPKINSTAVNPFPNYHEPETNLNAACIGAPIAGQTSGNWRLRVHNDAANDVATVNTWSITFCKDSIRDFPSSFFAWDNQDGMPLVDTVDPLVCPQNGGQYILTAYNIDFCWINDTININLYDLPDPGNDTTVQVCLETGVIDLFTKLGGTPHNNGTWEDPNGNPVNPLINSNAILDSLPYLYIAESVNGCLDSAYLIVDIIEVTIENTVLVPAPCQDSCGGQITIFSTVANAWSVNDPNTPTLGNSNVFTLLCDGIYDVTAFYDLPNSNDYCTATVTGLEITEPPLLEITDFEVNYIPGDVNSTTANAVTMQGCNDKSVILSANSTGGNPAGTHIFDWYLNSNFVGVGKDLTSPNNQEGAGYVVLDDGICPVDIAYFNFEHYTDIIPELDILEPEGCPGKEILFSEVSDVTNPNINSFSSATLFFSNGNSKIIQNSQTLNSGDGVIFNEAGSYSVRMEINSTNANTNGSGAKRALHSCFYEITNYDIVIRENPRVDFVATPDRITIYEPTSSMQNISPTGGPNDATDWVWDFGTHGRDVNNVESNGSIDFNPSVVYPDGLPGKYLIGLNGSKTYTSAHTGDQYTCTNGVIKEVQIINDVNIFAPNMFTPDGNSFNETWQVYISGIDIYDFELTIYNRYGEIVFKSFDSAAAWDGTFGNKGTLVQDGTYPWIVTAKDAIDDNKYQFKGTITIAK
ncbi:MAG: gliding motility-associated C-terminal domain-containing protein [Crocinitomicaceae bacterium]